MPPLNSSFEGTISDKNRTYKQAIPFSGYGLLDSGIGYCA